MALGNWQELLDFGSFNFQLSSNVKFKQTWNGLFSSGSDNLFDKSHAQLRKSMEFTLTNAIEKIEEQNRAA